MANQEENLSERVDPLTTGETTYDNEDVKGSSTFHAAPADDAVSEDPAEEATETPEEEAVETPDAQLSDVNDVPPASDPASEEETATPDNSVGDGQSA